MKRGIRRVRQSIKRRKRNKKMTKSNKYTDYTSLYLPEDEERHGIPSTSVNNDYFHKQNSSFGQSVWLKGIISLLLFASLVFILKTDYSRLEKPQQLAHYFLQEEFPFAKVNDWYVSTFGHPFAFLPESNQLEQQVEPLALPVSGNVTEPFNLNGEGIMISPNEKTLVSAFDRGVVIFAGNDRETDKTVVIQHPDDRKTTYGHLSSIDVHLYQSVQPNDRIGTFSPSTESDTVYFSIEQKNRFIDPVQVIKVDNSG